jgi:hypothetical protein
MQLMLKFLTAIILPFFLWAQYSGEPSDPQSNILRQEGKLVTISIVRGEPIKIFVLGKKGAEFSFRSIELEVEKISPQRKVLNVERMENYFVIKEPLEVNRSTNIEIKARVNNKEEKMLFKIPVLRP